MVTRGSIWEKKTRSVHEMHTGIGRLLQLRRQDIQLILTASAPWSWARGSIVQPEKWRKIWKTNNSNINKTRRIMNTIRIIRNNNSRNNDKMIDHVYYCSNGEKCKMMKVGLSDLSWTFTIGCICWACLDSTNELPRRSPDHWRFGDSWR